MVNKAHNKRRNAGLLYEFLVRTISQSLVEGDQRKSAVALKILRKHFKPGTELYREFRLINSLIKTTVSSDAVAASIMTEAKAAAKAYDAAALDREKSLLIKHINHSLHDDNFYDQQINEYRVYATIQTLMNDWRSDNRDKDLARMASYEDQLVRWLVSEKKEEDDALIGESRGTTRLLMKVMTKKLNEKYASALNEDQKAIIRSYAFATANNDATVMPKKLNEVRDKLLTRIDTYAQEHEGNEETLKKLTETRTRLVEENVAEVNDDVITRFMLYAKLNDELSAKE